MSCGPILIPPEYHTSLDSRPVQNADRLQSIDYIRGRLHKVSTVVEPEIARFTNQESY
jgi:hypothetical protein